MRRSSCNRRVRGPRPDTAGNVRSRQARPMPLGRGTASLLAALRKTEANARELHDRWRNRSRPCGSRTTASVAVVATAAATAASFSGAAPPPKNQRKGSKTMRPRAARVLRCPGPLDLLPDPAPRAKEQRLDGPDPDAQLACDLLVRVPLKLPHHECCAVARESRPAPA